MTSTQAASPPAPGGTLPTEIRTLVANRNLTTIIERCRARIADVVSSLPAMCDERGYTALHALVAYSRDASSETLAPVVREILAAADEVDFGGVYRMGDGRDAADESKVNANEIGEGEGEGAPSEDAGRAKGSWRLVLDQENRAKWSPLHLACVKGGVMRGKVALLGALLQMSGNRLTDDQIGEEAGEK